MNSPLFTYRIRIWMAWVGNYSFLIVSIVLSGLNTSYAQQSGLTSLNEDGFETVDWRNFRPHYNGDSVEFIRPKFILNETHLISGDYSLQWQAYEKDHEWMKISSLSNWRQVNGPVLRNLEHYPGFLKLLRTRGVGWEARPP